LRTVEHVNVEANVLKARATSY